MSHVCNAYCRDGDHCDLFYATPGTTEADLWQALGHYRGLKVTRCEPAREPPDPMAAADVIVGDRESATEAWLVWWR